jgi:hypothetical protein
VPRVGWLLPAPARRAQDLYVSCVLCYRRIAGRSISHVGVCGVNVPSHVSDSMVSGSRRQT